MREIRSHGSVGERGSNEPLYPDGSPTKHMRNVSCHYVRLSTTHRRLSVELLFCIINFDKKENYAKTINYYFTIINS